MGGVGDDLVERIAERIGQFVTGDGTGGGDMGPLVTTQHRDKVASYVDAGAEQGATLVVDGREGASTDGGEDCFLGPTAARPRHRT